MNTATPQTNLLDDLGLQHLPQEEKTEALLGIGRIIQQNVIIRVLEELSDKDKDEFDAFLANHADDQDATLNFLRSKVKNLDGIVADVIKEFKEGAQSTLQPTLEE